MKNTTEAEKEAEKPVETTAETPANETATPIPQTEGSLVLTKLQDELAESKDKYLRLYAEFENHRRRTAREKLEMIQGANEQLIKTLLPVVDDFERAEKSIKELSEKEGWDRLKVGAAVILTSDPKGVDPVFLAVFSKETVMLVPDAVE